VLASVLSAIRNRKVPVLLRWAAFFYLGHLVFQGKIAPSELGAFGAIFCLAWAWVRREVRPAWHILYYPLALYGIVSTLSALTSWRQIHSAGEAMLWFKMLIFPAALTLMMALPGIRIWVVRAHIFFGTFIACLGLYEFAFLEQRVLEYRITGPSTHVMTFSGLLLPISLMLFVLWIHERKWIYLVTGLIVSTALLLTFTRSVWFGWIFAMGVLLLLTRWRWLLWAAALLLFFVTFMPDALFGRLWSTFDLKQSSNLDRIRMFEAGTEIIKDYPLLGVGPANVKEIYPLYKKHDAPRFRPPHLHNNFIQLWAERGILGLLAYALVLALFLRHCAKAWHGPGRKWAEVGVAVVAGLTYAGLFEFNWGDTEVFYLTLDLFALVIAWTPLAETVRRAQPANEPLPVAVGQPA
jgi:O-antigen ligase